MSRKSELLVIALLLGVVYVLFAPLVSFVVGQEVDYQIHLSFIQDVMLGSSLTDFLTKVPHFLFHLLVVIVSVFTSGHLTQAAQIVTLGLYLLLALVMYWTIRVFLGKPASYRTGGLYIGMTVTLMLVMPIDMFTPGNLYLGYIVIHAYHNPTIVTLKPLALLLFVFAGAALDANTRRRIPLWSCIAVSLLAIIAKPSYTIALLPALAALAAWGWLRGKKINWRVVMVGIGFPSTYLLAVQLLVFKSEGFVIAPLAVFASWAERLNPAAATGILPKFLLSILFPLCVYLLYFPRIRSNVYLNLAWLSCAFGAGYTYLLAEAGQKLPDGNFTWSGQITLLVLFVMSLIVWIDQIRKTDAAVWQQVFSSQTTRLMVCGLVLGLHLISGIVWYWIHITTSHMGWIITTVW